MQLYIIRHAQSENNALYMRTGSFEGRSPDPPLSEIGKAQAQLLARFVAQGDPDAKTDQYDVFNQRGFGLTHLYCSLLRRSIETALAVSDAINIRAVAQEDLHEWGGIFEIAEDGEYRGLPGPGRSFFEKTYPNLVLPSSLAESGWWNKPHEQRERSFQRSRDYLDDLLNVHLGTGDKVALVTHAGFFHSLMSAIAEIPIEPTSERWHTRFLFAANNAAITRIGFDDRGAILHYLNRVDFLPRELIT